MYIILSKKKKFIFIFLYRGFSYTSTIMDRLLFNMFSDEKWIDELRFNKKFLRREINTNMVYYVDIYWKIDKH